MNQVENKWIPIMEPSLDGNELKYISNAVKTGWISSQGKYVDEFEAALKEFNNALYALAVSNGTVALHLALVSLGIRKGDEVILPDLTFAASINAILYSGATPVIVDVDSATYNINPKKIKKAISKYTKAIMPVHLYGNPCAMKELISIADKYGLLLIEDSAEAIGSIYGGEKLGSLSDVGTFSFYGNKTITTGEGGALLFKDKEVYQKAKVLRDHGMNPSKRYWHDFVGYNYRITNLQAAVGLAQMERIDDILNRKQFIAEYYQNELSSIEGVNFQVTQSEGSNSYWLVSLTIDRSNRSASELMDFLRKNNVDSRPFFYPLSEMPVYQNYCIQNELIVSKMLSKNGISLPSHIGLKDKHLEFICSKLKEYFNEK